MQLLSPQARNGAYGDKASLAEEKMVRMAHPMGVALPSSRLIWRISRGVSWSFLALVGDLTYPYVRLSSIAILANRVNSTETKKIDVKNTWFDA